MDSQVLWGEGGLEPRDSESQDALRSSQGGQASAHLAPAPGSLPVGGRQSDKPTSDVSGLLPTSSVPSPGRLLTLWALRPLAGLWESGTFSRGQRGQMSKQRLCTRTHVLTCS